MAAPSVRFWQRGGVVSLVEIPQTWWQHRASFSIGLAITFPNLFPNSGAAYASKILLQESSSRDLCRRVTCAPLSAS
jgi:hypothetical protein